MLQEVFSVPPCQDCIAAFCCVSHSEVVESQSLVTNSRLVCSSAGGSHALSRTLDDLGSASDPHFFGFIGVFFKTTELLIPQLSYLNAENRIFLVIPLSIVLLS